MDYGREGKAESREEEGVREIWVACESFDFLFLEFLNFNHTLVLEVNFELELGNSFIQVPALCKPLFGCWKLSHEQNARVPALMVLVL